MNAGANDDTRAIPRDGCAGCGATLADDQRYCLECGRRVGPLRVPGVLAGMRRRIKARPASNEGTEAAQLKSRHWIITDGNGKVEEVRGPGVVGQQPVLRAGEHFEYTSGCVLETPRGTMQGTYQMQRPDGSMFDAEIASFQLAMPHTLN